MTSVTTTTEKRDGGFRVSTERRVRLLRLATWWSVGTAVVLILAKGAAWLNTGSVSLLASLIDSLMESSFMRFDVTAALAGFIASQL